MAKSRAMVRMLLRYILDQASNLPTIRRHRCREFDTGSGCTMCIMMQRKYCLALTNFARKRGMITADLLEAEIALVNLIGSDKANNIMREQETRFYSGPSAECSSCGKTIKAYGGYAQIKSWMKRNKVSTKYLGCSECGGRAEITKRMLDKSDKNPKNKEPEVKDELSAEELGVLPDARESLSGVFHRAITTLPNNKLKVITVVCMDEEGDKYWSLVSREILLNE